MIVRLLSGVFCVAALAVSAVDAGEIRWSNGDRSVSPAMNREAKRDAASRLGDRAERHVVVYFDGPVTPDERSKLSAAGMRLTSYLGGDAYFATLARGNDSPRIAGVANLTGIEPVLPSRKLHRDLARGFVHPWQVVEAGAPDASGKPSPARVAVNVLFHRDFDGSATAVLERYGATVASAIVSLGGAVAHISMDRVAELAAADEVLWVEPPLPALDELNDSNRARVGVDVVSQPPYGLDGSGITVLVYDAGKVFAHNDLDGRLTIGLSDTDGISDHATHVACTIAGDGANGGGTLAGMAPEAHVVSYAFEQEGGLQQGFLYTDPGDIEADYSEAMTLYDVDLSNNSIGSNTAPNGFPCDWEGNYGVTGALIDEIVRGSLGEPFRVVWANGNERSGFGACGSTYLTTAPPACAKNHITVGALNSDDDSVTSFTSWGPCDDGRIKPDVSGPGCESGGDGGVNSCSSSGGYTVKCGTSMAAPTVAGVSTLLLQQYRMSFPGEPDFRNATLKAILAQTAVDVANPGPDFQTGYGSVRAEPAVNLIQEGRFLEDSVGQGETYSFLVLVGSDDPEVRVTLAWDDPSGTPDVNPVLVNDLDLVVIAPGGATHFPWTLDPANPGDPAVRTVRDGVNNIEQVVIDNPTPGAYRVEVRGFNVTTGGSQSFGIAAAPYLVDCTSAGVVSTSPSRVSCEAELTVEVVDCDLNTDDLVVEQTSVSVVSTTEAAGESLVLTELAPEASTFGETLPVSLTDAPGTLQVAHGDTVVVTYVDADDGAGGTDVPVTREVAVDCVAPMLTDVTVLAVEPRDATIGLTTNEPTRVTLHYGTSCASTGASVTRFAFSTDHEVFLAPLVDDTQYFFRVDLEDEAGNTATDDNGGACYTFTTPEVPDFFTESFSSGIDLEGISLTFTPNGSVDFYSMCREDLQGGLPTDPAGGTDLGLSDDQPGQFTLEGGAEVLLYGQAHSTVHVGPNGYVTFGSGDSDYTETLEEHFELPRIAAMYDDLNPSSSGAVTWKQLADRVAVTWEAVPQYNNSDSNTFQIEMFFDGRIRLSWLDVDTGDAIAGLSEGEGLDPDFLPNDLSAGFPCEPTPPTVEDAAATTTVSDPVQVTLIAFDDGEPMPTSLVYRIVELPDYATLRDTTTGTPIASVPYDLAGNVVTYEPVPAFGGQDAFVFRADDGGTAPLGGESADGHVTIEVTIGGLEAAHQYLVDDTDPGWSMTGSWAFGQPAGGGSANGDPSAGATGNNVLGYNLDGDYENSMGEEYLTSPPIDLSNVEFSRLEFQRWLGVDNAFLDRAKVQISVDDGAWTTLWQNNQAIQDDAWVPVQIPLGGAADGSSNVRLRWVMGSTSSSGAYPGWNIDDVRVLGVIVPLCAGAPTPATGVSFPGREQLAWSAAAPNGPSPVVYDVVRADGPLSFAEAATCVVADVSSTTATDTDVPAPESVFLYLVRPGNACGDASPGESSAGVERQAPTCEP